MPKGPRSRLWLVASFAALVIAVGLYLATPEQPTHKGKLLDEWLEQYGSSSMSAGDGYKTWRRDQASEAIREIGPNAIPHLLRMLRETDPEWREWLTHLGLIRVPRKPSAIRNLRAVDGFRVLGSDATQAVPALVEIYEQNLSGVSRSCAAQALAAIGPAASAALPSLLRGATNWRVEDRAVAVYALGEMRAAPTVVVPVLMTCLGDSNDVVRARAARALGQFGSNARPALPKLRELVEKKDRSTLKAAEQAIKQITP